jgi:hypothetical protein
MDDDLTTLMHQAVSDVQPADRLATIRQEAARRPRGRWIPVGGAVLATAAVVTGIAIVVQPSGDESPPPSTGTPTTVTSPTSVVTPTPALSAYAVYYEGQTPSGPRLFREFEQAPAPSALPVAIQLVTQPAHDPDYRTLWPADAFETAELRDDHIEVALADASLHDRPAGMSQAEAALALQQVVYTVQAAAHDRLPVQFVLDGKPIDTVLGEPTSEPVVNGNELDVLALVSISAPDEGRDVQGHFSANGVASSFEGTVHWEVRDQAGRAVLSGFAQGTMEDHLTPWSTDPIDVSGLTPGTYTFVATTDDPSAGEGPGPTEDTRTVIVR